MDWESRDQTILLRARYANISWNSAGRKTN